MRGQSRCLRLPKVVVINKGKDDNHIHTCCAQEREGRRIWRQERKGEDVHMLMTK